MAEVREEKRVYCGNLGCDLCRDWFAERGMDIMQMQRGDRSPSANETPRDDTHA